MQSVSESSLSEAETNKLIDQNMRLQKVYSTAEKEIENVKQQNIEIIHQRDFYQDQVLDITEHCYMLHVLLQVTFIVTFIVTPNNTAVPCNFPYKAQDTSSNSCLL